MIDIGSLASGAGEGTGNDERNLSEVFRNAPEFGDASLEMRFERPRSVGGELFIDPVSLNSAELNSISIQQIDRLNIRTPAAQPVSDFFQIQMIVQDPTIEIESADAFAAAR